MSGDSTFFVGQNDVFMSEDLAVRKRKRTFALGKDKTHN
jgi:hypothetical protein